MYDTIRYVYEISTPDGIVKQLNMIHQWCNDIKVVNSDLAMDQLKGPVLIMILRLDFKSESDKIKFDEYKNKPTLKM